MLLGSLQRGSSSAPWRRPSTSSAAPVKDADGAHDSVRFGIERSGALPGEAEATHQAQRVGPGLGVERDHQAVGPRRGRVERHAPVQGLDEVHVGLAQAGHELGGERGTRGAEKALAVSATTESDIPVRSRRSSSPGLSNTYPPQRPALGPHSGPGVLHVPRASAVVLDARGPRASRASRARIHPAPPRPIRRAGWWPVEVDGSVTTARRRSPAGSGGAVAHRTIGRWRGCCDGGPSADPAGGASPARPPGREQLRRAEHPGAGRGELDGERHAVEPVDQPGDVARHHVVRQGLRPRGAARSRNNWTAAETAAPSGSSSRGSSSGPTGNTRSPSTPNGTRLVASTDGPGRRRRGWRRARRPGPGRTHSCRPPGARAARLRGTGSPQRLEPELAGDDLVQRLGLGDSVQLHEPHPAGIPPCWPRPLPAPAGSSDAARADQRDDGVVDQQLADQLRLACPAEERRA